MAAAEIDALKKVRNTLVQARRKLVTHIQSLGPASGVAELTDLTDQLAKLQAGIEAVDKAIKDEGGLAPGAIGVSTVGRV